MNQDSEVGPGYLCRIIGYSGMNQDSEVGPGYLVRPSPGHLDRIIKKYKILKYNIFDILGLAPMRLFRHLCPILSGLGLTIFVQVIFTINNHYYVVIYQVSFIPS